MDVDQVLRRIPKTELHLHLEGAVAAETLADLARRHGVELPPHDDPAELYQYETLADFLLIYAIVSHSIRDQDDFRRVTYECLARCARDGARYAELFFSPESHLEIGVEYPTMLEGVIRGLKDAQDDLGFKVVSFPPSIGSLVQRGRSIS